MKWNSVKSESDIQNLMQVFGGFHDSCLKEMHVWSDHFVSTDLSMTLSGDLDTRVKVLCQRQYANPSAIELFFEEVTKVNIAPTPKNYDSVIYDATLLLRDEEIFFAVTSPWSPDDSDCNQETWISAKKLSWRDCSNWMGDKRYYCGGKETE